MGKYKHLPESMSKRALRRRREAYMRKYSIKPAHPHRQVPLALTEQLDRCADESARRLLLGAGRKQTERG
jgi:hypothetical protein